MGASSRELQYVQGRVEALLARPSFQNPETRIRLLFVRVPWWCRPRVIGYDGNKAVLTVLPMLQAAMGCVVHLAGFWCGYQPGPESEMKKKYETTALVVTGPVRSLSVQGAKRSALKSCLLPHVP